MSKRIEERSHAPATQEMDPTTGYLLPKLPALKSGQLSSPGDVFSQRERRRFEKALGDYENRRRIAESRQVNKRLGW